MSIGDLDLNGHKDIIIGNSHEPDTVFMNCKKGRIWKKITFSDKKFNTYDMMVFDLNGDGRLDIIESNSDDLNLYYFNRKINK